MFVFSKTGSLIVVNQFKGLQTIKKFSSINLTQFTAVLFPYEVPATADTLFYVRGLKPNEKYMAALAAYDENGKMIGGGIGLTCPPVLATHPLPSLMAWGYLAQVTKSTERK